MARLYFSIGATEYMEKLASSTRVQQEEAVMEGAELLKKYTALAGRSMLSGPYATGETVAGLTVKKGAGSDGASATVSYEGTHSYGDLRHGFGPRRLGEVAFVNEYGARGKAARPFNRTAIENNEQAIIQKMADVIFKE